jgi:hypothetical protein
LARCAHTYADSSQCKRIVSDGETYCYSHDPDRAEERKRNASKGGRRAGRGRSTPVSSELARLQARFEELADKILSSEVERGDGAVVAQLLNGARACAVGLLKAREQEELLERVAALEERQQQGTNHSSWKGRNTWQA